MKELILVRNSNQVCQVLFNRPQKKNAITADMYQLMADAINAAASDSSIKVIVLGSSNEHFTAGNDLGDFLANPSIAEGSPVYQFLQALLVQLASLAKDIRPQTGQEKIAQHHSAIQNYKKHHAENAPGRPLMNSVFGKQWTDCYLNHCLFA